MKVIFLQDLGDKGRAGESREVADGYARNFLIPRNLAVPATEGTMKQIELQLEREREHQDEERAKLSQLAKQMEGMSVRIGARIGTSNRLFGSVTSADVARALSEQVNHPIDKKMVEMAKPLRETGSHQVTLRLDAGLETHITVVIEGETG